MSSNRLIYDKCSYAIELKESTSPLDYYLYKGKYELNKQCPVGNHGNRLDFSIRADTENELFGLKRLGTLCPSKKYNPNNNFTPAAFSPARICENIHYITPNNIDRPITPMLNSHQTKVMAI